MMDFDATEFLDLKQRKELSLVTLTQEKIKQERISQGFDHSIDVKVKFQPKFYLHPTKEQNLFSTNTLAKLKPLPHVQSAPNNRLISLVIPVYNRDSYLGATIDSILAQTYTNFELIIWDDGSTDCSLDIAQGYAQKDSRIKVFNSNNQGQGTALVKAISQTNGQYLGTVDSDDLLHPEALAKTLEVLESDSNVGMVYTDHFVIDAEGKNRGIGKRCLIPYSQKRLLIDFMTFHFRLMRRDVYDANGGIDADLGTAEDYDLCLRLSEITKVVHLTEPLYYYRWHPNNISQTQQLKQIKCSIIAVNKALQRRGLSQKLRLEVKLNPKFIFQRQTKVANKVLGIGLSRTGTSSLHSALNLLGIPSIHFPRSIEQLKEFDGATGIPVALNYKQLDRLYPGSKFILTIRNPSSWLRSSKAQQKCLDRVGGDKISDGIIEPISQFYGQWEYNPCLWLSAYNLHLKSVMEYFCQRESDLLILDICNSQGWSELCSFLDCATPTVPFPHENRRKKPQLV
jgi:glycosyltransferase involved in cell wall biosynthesis